jgi:hypothetical protein
MQYSEKVLYINFTHLVDLISCLLPALLIPPHIKCNFGSFIYVAMEVWTFYKYLKLKELKSVWSPRNLCYSGSATFPEIQGSNWNVKES